MIISHRHKFIFIKTEKTAGTSIEMALASICGPEDIITPLVHPEDRAFAQSLGETIRKPQNYNIPMRKWYAIDLIQALKTRNWPKFYNHIGANEIKRFVDPQIWNSYFKFCFERNPWDKVVSYYYWWKKLEQEAKQDPAAFRRSLGSSARVVQWMINHYPIADASLSAAIESGRCSMVQGFDLYSIRNEIAVDHVAKFENLEMELEMIMKRIGVSTIIPLPKLKSTSREKKHYRELLNEKDKNKIAKVFAREIAYFGYEF